MNVNTTSRGDRLYMAVTYFLLWFALIVMAYPLVYILSCSFSSPVDLVSGRVWLWPVKPTLMAYKAVFASNQVLVGYRNSLLYTVVGTAINVVITLLAAYPLSRKAGF